MSQPDLIVLFEHPEWQEPLFRALRNRNLSFDQFDLKRNSLCELDSVRAPLYFNQASPSAYTRGNTRAVPFALEAMEFLEREGARVLNGSAAFRLELSKFAQSQLLRKLKIPHPASILFNDASALRDHESVIEFPAILKPNQGGSGARMFKIESIEEVESLLESQPDLWLPDNLLVLQQYIEHDTENHGIVRMEFLGDELLYAMRVVTGGAFNLCPSEVCNPADPEGEGGSCQVPTGPKPEFYPFPEVPADIVEQGLRIMKEGRLDVGGIEYLEGPDGRRYIYDINANSNLRPSVAEAFGFDPFERVADYLEAQVAKQR